MPGSALELARVGVKYSNCLPQTSCVSFKLSPPPSCLLSLCLSNQDSYGAGTAHGSRIGGTSGGVRNDELVRELEQVALEHVSASTR